MRKGGTANMTSLSEEIRFQIPNVRLEKLTSEKLSKVEKLYLVQSLEPSDVLN